MKPKIDKDLCIGCGYCNSVCPKIFEVGEDEKAFVIATPDEGDYSAVYDAMSGCPVNAITED